VKDEIDEELVDKDGDADGSVEDESLKLMVELLKQFVAFTSGTSSRAAKVMSAHYFSSILATPGIPLPSSFKSD